ncbi:hypothetical protein DVH02_32465 [Streptomyces corynorhini]|uniref:Uncharacterized protein n=1 Tax=Streptomyces corynorhini TaxID=2282652 RepID=A0A370AZ90_9ACTN|nr:hypothetical protein DVH02_32465 [Streptomyces corynorhini]
MGEPRPGSDRPGGRALDPDRQDRQDRQDQQDQQSQQEQQELELRVLLERAVPRLPDPEGRLAGVRERVVLARRRRRTAGAAAATVTALVLAGVLLPGVLRGGSGPVLPAAPVPSVSHHDDDGGRDDGDGRDGRGATPEPSRSDGQDERVRFPQLGGLSLRLLPGWRAQKSPEDAVSGPYAHAFLANQPLADHPPACDTKELTECGPIVSLLPGGALVSIAPASGDARSIELQGLSELSLAGSPSSFCRNIGGTKEYGALLAGPSNRAEFTVSLCLGGDSPVVVEDVHTMIASADFVTGPDEPPTNGSTATAATGSGPTHSGPTFSATPPRNAK